MAKKKLYYMLHAESDDIIISEKFHGDIFCDIMGEVRERTLEEFKSLVGLQSWVFKSFSDQEIIKKLELKEERTHATDEIFVYCDGSCNNHTKTNGSYGIVLLYNGHEKHISGPNYIGSTSARMEILGLLESLRAITNKALPVTIYCDNQYVCKSISERWALKWESELWLTGQGEDNLKWRLNYDLWKQVLIEYRKFPEGNVKLTWLKGHDGDKYNELADKLANIGAHSKNIIQDIIPEYQVVKKGS